MPTRHAALFAPTERSVRCPLCPCFVRFNLYVEASARDSPPHLDVFDAHVETDKARTERTKHGSLGCGDRSRARGRLFNRFLKTKGDCLAPRPSTQRR